MPLAFLLSCVSCAKAPNPAPLSGQESSKTVPLTPIAADAMAAPNDAAPGDGGARPGPLSLRDAMLREAWPEARSALVALPTETQKLPVYRYAAGSIAHALGDDDGALTSLAGLEQELPDLRDRILDLRASSASVHGPYEIATEIWLRRGGARASLLAAQVFAKTQNFPALERAVNLVLSDPKRTAAQETEARALRLGFPQTSSIQDARWLFIHAPGHDSAKAVEAALDKERGLPPRRLFSDAEMKSRFEAWEHTGKVDEALAELDALKRTNAIHWTAQEHCRTRAHLLYSARSRYADAATAYATCAALGGKEQPENLFYEARSFSRANQDDVAVKKYGELSKRFPRSPFAVQAKQLRARLLTLNGLFGEAAKAWDELPASEDRERLRALSHLLAGHAKTAEGILARLSESSHAKSPAHALRLRELHALARDASGDTSRAIADWKEIVREAPLSFAALVARERLLERNVAVDPMPALPAWAGSGARAPLDRGTKAVAGLRTFNDLVQIGLGAEAEELLHGREALVQRQENASAAETLCDAYGATGHAKRRFRMSGQASPTALFGASHDCRYPMPFAEIMQEATRDTPIPPAYAYAIMRTESAFDPEVHSPAAAVGLMQLLPDTAKRVGEAAHLDFAPLENARVNIYLGVRYLAQVQSELGASLPLVAASYNAGPEAVQRWLSHLRPNAAAAATKGRPNIDLALFCELIPYGETRAYVFQVMESYAHYAYAMGGMGGGAALPRFSLSLPPV